MQAIGYWLLIFGMSLMTVGFSIVDPRKPKEKGLEIATEWEEDKDGKRVFYDKNGRIKNEVQLLPPPDPVSRWQ